MVLAYELTARILFPWDFYMWAESTFLTNMLKIRSGVPIYGNPADGNSFLYSPGLEFVTYGLLAPFGAALDIRACRAVSVLLCVAAVVTGGFAASEVAADTRTAARRFKGIFSAVSLLVLFRGFSADVPHPDNLHIFHFAVAFGLTSAALRTKRFGLATVAALWAGFGVLTKQTAAPTVVGVIAILLLEGPSDWRTTSRLIAIPLVGALSLALCVGAVFATQYGRLYLFTVPTSEVIMSIKIPMLLREFTEPYRLIPTLLLLPVAAIFFRAGRVERRYLVTWLFVGACAAMPNVLAYLKIGGGANNLRVADFWLLLLVLPGIFRLSETARAPLRIAATLSIAAIALAAFPIRLPPSARMYAYGREFDESIGKDVHDGAKRILVAHETMPLIRNGILDPPLDRAVSIAELGWAGKSALGDLERRIRSGYYDRLYMNWDGPYGAPLLKLIDDNYREVATIPAYWAPARGSASFFDRNFGVYDGEPYGYQGGMMGSIRVMAPRRGQ